MLRAVVVIILLTACACGYQMVGLSKSTKNAAFFYYLNEIRNNSTDQTVTSDMQNYVTRFFTDYDSLRPKSTAQYELTIALEAYDVSAATTSSSREAVTSNMTLSYSFNVTDKSGKNLYQQTISRNQNFSSSGDAVTDYDTMLTETFTYLTEDIMSVFKIDFEINNR